MHLCDACDDDEEEDGFSALLNTHQGCRRSATESALGIGGAGIVTAWNLQLVQRELGFQVRILVL